MAYSTEADVKVRFPLLVDCPALSITAFIAQADASIDTILAGKNYVVPVAVPDEMLEWWSVLKAGLSSWSSLDASKQTNAMDFDWVQSEIERIEGGIVSGEIKFAYPKNSSEPSVASDSLVTPSYSQFKLPGGFGLNTDE